MRIERLSAENSRTQGPGRRAWYAQHNPEHLRGVASVVERALAERGSAGARAPGGAIVLGACACTEVPLERLARACAPVTLVDLDRSGMEQARRSLPHALRTRVELLRLDLTGGVSDTLAALLREPPWADLARLGAHAVVEAAARCLESCPVADPPMLAELRGRRFGLVLSSLALTQLFGLPLLDALDTIGQAAPEALSEASLSPDYQAAANQFRRRVALAHLDLLAALLAPAGAAALVSDLTGYLAPPTSAPPSAPREALPVLPPEALNLPVELRARFAVRGAPHRWEWRVTTPTRTQPGRAYAVGGYVLRAKPVSSAPAV